LKLRRHQYNQPAFSVWFDSTLARYQLTFYHRPVTETTNVAWLVKAA